MRASAPADSSVSAPSAPGITAASGTASADAGDARPNYFYRSAHEVPVGNNFGVAYDLSIRFSLRERRLYREDFDTPRELYNQLSYVRYGRKGQIGVPYIRLGVLDSSRLGYGQVLAYYDNTPQSAINPKRGLEAGMNLGFAGMELIAGDITRLQVVGARVYGRPFASLGESRVSHIQLGATAATDFAPGAGYNGGALAAGALVHSGSVNDVVYARPTVFGADITVPLLRDDTKEISTYADLAQLKDGGHGGVLALQLYLPRVRHSSVLFKAEHRIVGDHYRPSYFDGYYETERFQLGGSSSDALRSVNTRFATTLGAKSWGNAGYGEIRAITPRLSMWTFYQRLYGDSKSGWAHVELDSRTIVPRVAAHVWYDKWSIQDGSDLFHFDARSRFQAALGARLYRHAHYLLVSRWEFVAERDYKGDAIRWIPQRSTERRITFQLPF